jgi:hypothetical protein
MCEIIHTPSLNSQSTPCRVCELSVSSGHGIMILKGGMRSKVLGDRGVCVCGRMGVRGGGGRRKTSI